MIKYTIGDIIRRERKLQGLSQEQLSDGICTASWLSKIESGACIPTHTIFETLMQRLGKSGSQYVLYQSELEMEIDRLKFQTRRLYSTNNIEEAKESYNELKEIVREENKQDIQFMMLYDILLNKDGHITPEVLLQRLNEAIDFSIPNFEAQKLSTYLLSKDEIVLINNLAICHYKLNQSKNAITIAEALRTYLENPKFDYEERRRTYPVVMSNLAKWLTTNLDYFNSLNIAEKGIDFCNHTDTFSCLPELLYYKAYALAAIGSEKLAKKTFCECYYLFMIKKETDNANLVLEYALSTHGIDLTECVTS